jgi:hypothetical protein
MVNGVTHNWGEWARFYAAHGLPVFPAYSIIDGHCSCPDPHCTDQGKHPTTPNGLNAASVDPRQIDAWAAVPGIDQLNIGIAVPDGFVVVDVDPKNGGWEDLRQLEAEIGPLPTDTLSVRTGSGGVHIWFRIPPGYRLPGKLLPGRKGVDTRQEGGYVIAPPSKHLSGNAYTWIVPPPTPIREYAPLSARATPRGALRGAALGDDGDTPEVSLSPEARQVTADLIRPYFVDGQKHFLAKFLAGWAKQRGWAQTDVEAIVTELGPKNLQAKIDVIRAAYQLAKSFGYAEMLNIVGRDTMGALEHSPNPRWEREQQFRSAGSAMAAAVAASAATVTAPTAGNPFPAIQWVNINEEPEPITLIVEHLGVTYGKPLILFAFPGGGKSPVVDWLAIAVAHGLSFLGKRTLRTHTLLICAEGERLTRVRMSRMRRALGLEYLAVNVARLLSPLAQETITQIEALIASQQFGLVVIDTYGAAISPEIDHNTSEFSAAAKAIEHVSERTKCAFVLLMHSNKDTSKGLRSIAGHGSIAGAAQEAWEIQQIEGARRLKLCVVRAVEDVPAPIEFEIVDVHGATGPKHGLALQVYTAPPDFGEVAGGGPRPVDPAKLPALDAAIMRIRALMSSTDDWVPLAAIDAQAGGNSGTRTNAIKALLRADFLELDQRGLAHYYRRRK